MSSKLSTFYALKFIQAGFKNAKYYLAMVLLFTIKEDKTSNTNDNTIDVLIYLCFFSLILSRVLSWIFLQDFSRKLEAFLMLPLHLTGLIDFIYILQDATCNKPHNSLRFYISNILSLFCYPAYIIVVILIDFLYEGIENQIITTVVMLSSICEVFVYYVFGMRTAAKINNFTNFYSIVQLYEFLTSLSFLGLIIINIRYSLPFLITYFSTIPVLLIILPCFTSTFYVKFGKVGGFWKMIYLTSFWLCIYQPCINRIAFKKKIFANINSANNKFYVSIKFFFYQFAYIFFVAYLDDIKNSVSNSNQINVLFIIASICQFKLVCDVFYSFFQIFRTNKSELEINSHLELEQLITSAHDNKNYSHVKKIIINIFPHISDESASKIFHLCMCLLKDCEIVVNNSNNGRFFYEEDKKTQIVKLDQINYISYENFVKINETEKILPDIHFLALNLASSSAKSQNGIYSFLKTIHNSNILHFNLKYDKSNNKLEQPIALYQHEQVKGVMQFLVFKTYIAQHLMVNPALVIYDLYDN